MYGAPVGTCIFVSSLSCGHTYTPFPLFATFVSRIVTLLTLAIPYDGYVTYPCDYQYLVSDQARLHFHLAIAEYYVVSLPL
jgi:hypothetical protein